MEIKFWEDSVKVAEINVAVSLALVNKFQTLIDQHVKPVLKTHTSINLVNVLSVKNIQGRHKVLMDIPVLKKLAEIDNSWTSMEIARTVMLIKFLTVINATSQSVEIELSWMLKA